jgi:hypothetical protein
MGPPRTVRDRQAGRPRRSDDPAVADVIADWKKTPGTVGIRIMMTKEAQREPNDPGRRCGNRIPGLSVAVLGRFTVPAELPNNRTQGQRPWPTRWVTSSPCLQPRCR